MIPTSMILLYLFNLIGENIEVKMSTLAHLKYI